MKPLKRRCSQQLCVCVWRRKSTDISGSLGCSALGCRPRLEAKCASGFKRDAARLDRRARSRPRANEQVRPKTNRSGGQPSRSEARRGRGRPKPQILLLLAACCPRAPLFVIITRARAPKLRRRPSACSRRAPPPPPTSMSAPEATRASPLERVAGGSHLIWRRLRARPLACRRAPDLRAQINNKLARRLAAARSCRQLDLPVVCGLILGACDRLDSSLGLRLAGFGRDFSSWTKREREPGRLFEATFWGNCSRHGRDASGSAAKRGMKLASGEKKDAAEGARRRRRRRRRRKRRKSRATNLN